MRFEKESPADQLLAQATHALRNRPEDREPDPALMARALQLSQTIAPQSRRWTRLLGAASLAAAAAITIIILLLLQNSTPLAFADVAEKIRQTNTFTATLQFGERPRTVSAKGDRLRISDDRDILIFDFSTKKQLVLWLTEKTAYQKNVWPPQVWLMERLNRLVHDYTHEKTADAGEKLVDGIKTQGFTIAQKSFDGTPSAWIFWVDPSTKLPVEVDIARKDDKPLPVLSHIHYGVELADAIFDTTLPPGYTLADLPDSPWDRFAYAGDIVDDTGKPLPDVEVMAELNAAGMNGSRYYIASATTNAAGHFSMDVQYGGSGVFPNEVQNRPVTLYLNHSDFLPQELGNVHLFSPEQRQQFHLRMSRGLTLEGTITSSDGKPLANALVDMDYGKGGDKYRKGTLTDINGKYTLRGLASSKGNLRVLSHADGHFASGTRAVNLEKDIQGSTNLVATPIAIGTSHEFMGMKVAELTPEIRDRLFLWWLKGGVLITDVGTGKSRLSLTNLDVGDCIWMLDEKDITNYHDCLQQMLIRAKTLKATGTDIYRIRIVTTTPRVDTFGSDTEHARFTQKDVDELQQQLATTPSISPSQQPERH